MSESSDLYFGKLKLVTFFQPTSICILWGGVELGNAFSGRFILARWEYAHIGATKNPEKEEWTYSEEYSPFDSALGSWSHTWSFSVRSIMALPEA